MIAMDSPVIQAKGLSHRYAAQWAVKDIDLEVAGKGVYGLLGANGAGKSTIMNIVCGVLKQTSGEVFINGIDLKKNPIEAKRHIGFLPQQPPIIPELNVEEYLTYCAHLRFMPQAEISAAVETVMSKVRITHFRDRLIGNLSGGYQQRVGIAQAIIHKPNVVVLDEPTNGLDPNQIFEVRNLIKEIAQERTVILSTHILQEVQALCDHIWMINEGSVVFSGTIDSFDNYIVPSTLLVTLRSNPTTDEIESLSAVKSADHLGNGKYRIHYDDHFDAADQLVLTSVERGWHLSEMVLEKSSLDAIFLELSTKKLH